MHRAGDGVGNIVQFQIEEDRQAEMGDLVDAVVAVRAEELEPELESADMALDLLRERLGGVEPRNVEREEDRVVVHVPASFWGLVGLSGLSSAGVSGSGSTESGMPSPSRSRMRSVLALA